MIAATALCVGSAGAAEKVFDFGTCSKQTIDCSDVGVTGCY